MSESASFCRSPRPGLHLTIVGLLLLAVMLFLPEGVAPALALTVRLRARRPAAATPAAEGSG
jgi:hypothetical protein